MRFSLLIGLAASVSNVLGAIHVDDQSFDANVFGGPQKYSLVYFSSPNCPWCRLMDPEVEPLTELYNGTAVAYYEIDAYHNKGIPRRYHIRGYPHLVIFDSNTGIPVGEFDGERKTPVILTYIEGKTGVKHNELASYVLKPEDERFEADVLGNSDRDALLAFYEPWDDELGGIHTSYLEKLARQHNAGGDAKVVFGGVNDTHTDESNDLISQFMVGQFPTFYLLPAGNGSVCYKLEGKGVDVSKVEGLLNGEDVGQQKVDLKEEADKLERLAAELGGGDGEGGDYDYDNDDDDDDDDDEIRRLRDMGDL